MEQQIKERREYVSKADHYEIDRLSKVL
jgi:hypothetical protein